MLTLEPPPKVITFDCYGTLVQWHRVMRDAARAILSDQLGLGIRDEQVIALADAIRAGAVERQLLPFRRYAAVLRASLEAALSSIGLAATEDDHQTLWSLLARIPPHDDVRIALQRLRTQYQIAIISNTDDDLIAGTVEAIGVPIDHVVTAQQARVYKPDHQLFAHAHRVIRVSKDETIHVGMGQFTDLKVCAELGIRSVWIDRLGEPLDPAWSPDAVLPDLAKLPELLHLP